MIVHDPENNALRVDMLLMPYSNLDKKPYVDNRILNGYATGPKVRLSESGTWGNPQKGVYSKGSCPIPVERGDRPGFSTLGTGSERFCGERRPNDLGSMIRAPTGSKPT